MTISVKIIADSVSPHGIRLTTFQLQELFEYNENTGKLYHKKSRRGVRAGTAAGSIKADGYVHVKILGTEYYAHRVIWQMMYGDEMPPMIDHINGYKADNRLVNLRAATSGQNMANSLPRKDNRTGVKGVRKIYNRYAAAITINGKQVHLGMFHTIEEASAAYAEAARAHHGEFARP